jgi:tetratricopeptide (TPR) repeat protein
MQGGGPGRLQHEGGVPSSQERKPSRQQQQVSRSTYAEKFQAMVQEAQDARIKAAHQRDLQDRRSLSVSILSAGRAEAFVDFFMLTQPPAATSAGQGPDSSSSSVGGTSLGGLSSVAELPWQSMVLLQEQLVRADAANREGDLQTAFDAHRTMAKHFAQLGMLENTVFFWKRCLQVREPSHTLYFLGAVASLRTALRQAPGCLLSQVAVSAADGPEQLEASCALGLLYESQGQPALAMACHERCLQLSQELQRPDDAATAYAQLVQVWHLYSQLTRMLLAPCSPGQG